MKWFHKGFILAAACFLLAMGAVEAAPVVEPPSVVITHNRIIGDSPAILFSGSAYMKPLAPVVLHLRANEESEKVASLEAGEGAKVVGFEVHSFPNNGRIQITGELPIAPNLAANKGKELPKPGDTAYILFYAGEGYFYAWFKNNLIYLPGSGISSLPFNGDLGIARLWAGYKGVENRGEEMWFCLQKSTGEEGWVKFADRAQWQPGAPGNGVFLGQP